MPVEPAVFRIDCTAYRVRDRGSTVEEEIAFGKMNKGHFQAVLNEALAALSPKADQQK